MKLKEGFILHQSKDEYMAVASGEAAKVFNGLIRNNSTADFIFQKLLKETTEEQIVEAMAEVYDAPKEVIEKDVHMLVEKIRKAGFLDE